MMEYMKGIEPRTICHELNVDPTFKPIKQKRQKLGQERAHAVNDEVERLLEAGSIAHALVIHRPAMSGWLTRWL